MIVDRKMGNSTAYVVEERTEETRETPIVHISRKKWAIQPIAGAVCSKNFVCNNILQNSDRKGLNINI